MSEFQIQEIDEREAREIVANSRRRGQYDEVIAKAQSGKSLFVQPLRFGQAWGLVKKAKAAGLQAKVVRTETEGQFGVVITQ